jgi:hypothetical protein
MAIAAKTNIDREKMHPRFLAQPYVLYSNATGNFALPADAVFIVTHDGFYPLEFDNETVVRMLCLLLLSSIVAVNCNALSIYKT